MKHKQPALISFDNQPDMAAAFVTFLAKYHPGDNVYKERMSHRILRRTFASYLHHLGAPLDVLIYLLNHAGQQAVPSYVCNVDDVNMLIPENDDIFDLFIPVPGIDPELDGIYHPEPNRFNPKYHNVTLKKRTRYDNNTKHGKVDHLQLSITEFFSRN